MKNMVVRKNLSKPAKKLSKVLPIMIIGCLIIVTCSCSKEQAKKTTNTGVATNSIHEITAKENLKSNQTNMQISDKTILGLASNLDDSVKTFSLLKQEKYSQAKPFLKKIIEFRNQLSESDAAVDGHALKAASGLAKVCFAETNNVQAIKVANEGIKIAKDSKVPQKVIEGYIQLYANILKRAGDINPFPATNHKVSITRFEERICGCGL